MVTLADVYSSGHVTGGFFRAGTEVVRYASGTKAKQYGAFGFGAVPPNNTQSSITAADTINIVSGTAGLDFKLYSDTATSGWKYFGNGYDALIRLESGGGIQYYTAANNTSGAGAAAVLTPGPSREERWRLVLKRLKSGPSPCIMSPKSCADWPRRGGRK